MKKGFADLLATAGVVAGLCMFTDTAHAYLGPGAGVSAIGSILAILLAVIVGIFGFIWYPIKRLIAGKRKRQPEVADVTEVAGQEDAGSVVSQPADEDKP